MSRLSRPGVRASTTLAAVGVLAVAFAASGVLLVGFLHQSLRSSLDSAASARAQDVAALAQQGRLTATVASTGQQSSLVQVVGPGGTVLSASENIVGEPALARGPAARVPSMLPDQAAPIASSTELFRLLAVPVRLPQGDGWIFVATSLLQVDTTVSRLTGALALGLPTLLLVVGGVIWVMVGRALAPVERIRQQSDTIGGSALDRRVPVPASRDAVGRLAETMNRMLDRLQASADRQRRFVGDASHELKSPLTALRAQVDVALAYPDDVDVASLLGRVRQESDRMAVLVDDLLFLAGIDEGRRERRLVRVDLDELLLDEVHRLRAAGVTVTVTATDAMPITGSAGDLRRLLRNLGDNAVTHARSTVELGLRSTAHGAVLTVADDGPGVPSPARELIFDRFARLDERGTRSAQTGGTGLGLSIAREIARAHGGSLTVADRPGGGPGACFTLRLPGSRETVSD